MNQATIHVITPVTTPAGFEGQLSGANIVDLIQLNCMSQTCAAYLVQSGHQQGMLVFGGGEIVHAALGDATGEPALRQILDWKTGRFRPCPTPHPAPRTLHAPWQSVLLKLAQETDEAGGAPRQAAHPVATDTHPTDDLETIVRVSSDGTLSAAKGKHQDQIADAVAYVTCLAQSLGAELGLGAPTALDLTMADDRMLVIRRESQGSWLGLLGGTKEIRRCLEHGQRR